MRQRSLDDLAAVLTPRDRAYPKFLICLFPFKFHWKTEALPYPCVSIWAGCVFFGKANRFPAPVSFEWAGSPRCFMPFAFMKCASVALRHFSCLFLNPWTFSRFRQVHFSAITYSCHNDLPPRWTSYDKTACFLSQASLIAVFFFRKTPGNATNIVSLSVPFLIDLSLFSSKEAQNSPSVATISYISMLRSQNRIHVQQLHLNTPSLTF